MNPDLGYVELTLSRLRQIADDEERNPPESGYRILPPLTASARVRAQYARAREHVREVTR